MAGKNAIQAQMDRIKNLNAMLAAAQTGGNVDLDQFEEDAPAEDHSDQLEPIDDPDSKEAKPDGPMQGWTIGQVLGWLRELETKSARQLSMRRALHLSCRLCGYSPKFERAGWTAEECAKWNDKVKQNFGKYMGER